MRPGNSYERKRAAKMRPGDAAEGAEAPGTSRRHLSQLIIPAKIGFFFLHQVFLFFSEPQNFLQGNTEFNLTVVGLMCTCKTSPEKPEVKASRKYPNNKFWASGLCNWNYNSCKRQSVGGVQRQGGQVPRSSCLQVGGRVPSRPGSSSLKG